MSTSPRIINCPEGQWTLVAANITTGVIYRLSDDPGTYLYTYRETGNAPPSGQAEGLPIFLDSEDCEDCNCDLCSYKEKRLWKRDSAVDIYIWAADVSGKVRADTAEQGGPVSLQLINDLDELVFDELGTPIYEK